VVCGERGDGPTDEPWGLGGGEVQGAGGLVAPALVGDAEDVEHGPGAQATWRDREFDDAMRGAVPRLA
jgi:hypothetical protein